MLSPQARGFSIIEETSISKGIRRITAFTGPAAKQADKDAQFIKSQIEACASCEGAALVDAEKSCARMLKTAQISVVDKDELKKALKVQTKRKVALMKKISKEMAKKALDG